MNIYLILVLVYYFLFATCAFFGITDLAHQAFDRWETRKFERAKLDADKARYNVEKMYR